MAGGNIAAGAFMVLGVILITTLVAFIQVGDTGSASDLGCDYQGNATTCEGGSTDDFLDAFFDVTVTGIQGAPVIVNTLYLLATVGSLVVGLALIIFGIASVPFGGG